jgi:hypothetical protein
MFEMFQDHSHSDWQLVSMAEAFAFSGLSNPMLADAIAAEAMIRAWQPSMALRRASASKAVQWARGEIQNDPGFILAKVRLS